MTFNMIISCFFIVVLTILLILSIYRKDYSIICFASLALLVVMAITIGGSTSMHRDEQVLCYKAVTTCAGNGLPAEVTDLEDYKEWLKEYAGSVVMDGGVATDVTMILANVKEVGDE